MAGFCFNRIGACSELVCFEWPLGLHSRAEILFSCQASLATVGGGAPLGWMPQLIKNEACCCLQTSIRARPPGLVEARSPCGYREASSLLVHISEQVCSFKFALESTLGYFSKYREEHPGTFWAVALSECL